MNPIVNNYIKEAYASDQEILDVASQYYDNNDPDDPKHRWDHMLDVMDVAKKIRGRDLDKDEFGMIAFHDSGYKHPKGYAYSKSRHPMFGAKIFRKEGPKLGYSPEEIKRIAKVIAYHNHRPDYASSPLLKDDMQMLLFSADEGTPIDLKDDAKMYYIKGRNGVYKGVDPKSKDFIKQLVAKVKTFGNYSKLKRLKYYNDVYPGYLQSKYDFWQSPDLEKYYKELYKKDKKKEDKYTIHGAILGCLGDNAKKFKYNITEDLSDDPWGAIIHTKPMTMAKVRQFHSYHNIDVDGAGVPYYFLTKNERTGDKYVWYSDDAEPIRINSKEEKDKAKEIGLSKGLVPEQLDFKFTEKKSSYDKPLSLKEIKSLYGNDLYKKLSKDPVHKWRAINGIELLHEDPTEEEFERILANWQEMDDASKELSDKESIRLFGKKNLDRVDDIKGRYKKASVDISDIVNAYKDQYGFDLSHMKGKHSKKPRYNNGKIAKDIPVESYGGSWAKNNTIYLNPDMDAVSKYYGVANTDDLRKTIVAHELAHEVYNKQATKEYIKKIVDEAKKKKFTTAYLKTVPDRKIDEETFCEYLANGLNKKAGKLYTYVDPEADLSKGLLSARLAPEDVLMRRYPNSGAKNKKELLEMMQTRFKDDKDRPSLIYALSSPIPDTANSRLLRFRANHKLVSYETDKIKDLVKLLKRRYRKPPVEVKDVEPGKYIQWGRTPKDGGAFFYAPVYKVLTESGKIDPELLTIE